MLKTCVTISVRVMGMHEEKNRVTVVMHSEILLLKVEVEDKIEKKVGRTLVVLSKQPL